MSSSVCSPTARRRVGGQELQALGNVHALSGPREAASPDVRDEEELESPPNGAVWVLAKAESSLREAGGSGLESVTLSSLQEKACSFYFFVSKFH